MGLKAKFRDDLAFLSNMHPSIILYRGIEYPSVEHAYQLQKMPLSDLRYEHLRMTPSEVKHFARTLDLPPDWEKRKLEIMRILLEIKFQNPGLRSKLMEVPDSDLVEENSWHDNFWGVCQCDQCGNQGENHLGLLLQEVKHRILSNQL